MDLNCFEDNYHPEGWSKEFLELEGNLSVREAIDLCKIKSTHPLPGTGSSKCIHDSISAFVFSSEKASIDEYMLSLKEESIAYPALSTVSGDSGTSLQKRAPNLTPEKELTVHLSGPELSPSLKSQEVFPHGKSLMNCLPHKTEERTGKSLKKAVKEYLSRIEKEKLVKIFKGLLDQEYCIPESQVKTKSPAKSPALVIQEWFQELNFEEKSVLKEMLRLRLTLTGRIGGNFYPDLLSDPQDLAYLLQTQKTKKAEEQYKFIFKMCLRIIYRETTSGYKLSKADKKRTRQEFIDKHFLSDQRITDIFERGNFKQMEYDMMFNYEEFRKEFFFVYHPNHFFNKCDAERTQKINELIVHIVERMFKKEKGESEDSSRLEESRTPWSMAEVMHAHIAFSKFLK